MNTATSRARLHVAAVIVVMKEQGYNAVAWMRAGHGIQPIPIDLFDPFSTRSLALQGIRMTFMIQWPNKATLISDPSISSWYTWKFSRITDPAWLHRWGLV